MKILVLSQYYYPEPFRLHDICEELVNRGHEVTVLTGIPNYPDGDIYLGYEKGDSEEYIKGVKVIRCGIRPRKKGKINLFLNYLSFWIKATNRIKKIDNDFDAVYSYQLSPITSSFPAIVYCRQKKVPSLMYCLDLWPESVVGQIPKANLIFKLIKTISTNIYNGFDKVLVSSPSFIDYLKRVCYVKNESLTYIPQHANDLGLIGRSSTAEEVNFMFLGNVGESQNLEGLIHAASRVDSNLRFKIHIVGSGSRLNSVKELTKRFALEEKVIFHGRQPKSKLIEYYRIADVCLVSLRNEGAVGCTIPGKLQEYMSAGKAILGSIDGDARVVIEEAQCGLCCEAENVEAYAANIEQMIKERHKIEIFGQNAREYYIKHFTLDNHVDALENELNSLVDNTSVH